jgi:hypothetical protein
MNVGLNPEQKDLFRILTLNAFILGLLFIVWARDKMEDEMTLSLKLKSMYWSTIWGAIYCILNPLVDLAFGEKMDLSAQELIISMMVLYLITYYLEKRGR